MKKVYENLSNCCCLKNYSNEELTEVIRSRELIEAIRSKKRRIEILSTIDELNQYLNGNVTISGLKIALQELIDEL